MAKTKETDIKIDTEEMAQQGLHFGHRTSKVHPKMKPFLYGVRNAIHIIDLEKTAEKLKEALKFVQNLVSENKTLVLVGTKIQIKDLVEEIAKACNLPYVNERWLGGTFTNFEVIRKRVAHLEDLEKLRAAGELEKYTKKEKAKIEREIKNLQIKFGGIRNLNRLPDAIFVLDMKKDILAVKEARAKGAKVIGICHTNVNPALADYAIPANDDARSAVKYILEKLKEAIIKTKK